MICLSVSGQDLSVSTAAYTDTEVIYTDAKGKNLKIQNSLPKGGGTYISATGQRYGYAVFWTRVVNETSLPVELNVHFPVDPIDIPSNPVLSLSPDSHLRLFLPPDVMQAEKASLYNYGIRGLESFLEKAFDRPASLKRILKPEEEIYFYVVMLSSNPGGAIRAGLVLKDQALFYKFSIGDNTGMIPCGEIVFRD